MKPNGRDKTGLDWICLDWTWECENELIPVIVPPSRSLSLSLSEIVTSSRKWRPLECNQNYHRLEFDRNQHHMECDGNYCPTSGQKVCLKVWNVWKFPNFSDIICFRLNTTSEVQKCASGWSGIDLWIAGVSGTTLMVEGHVTPLWPLAHSCHAKTYLDQERNRLNTIFCPDIMYKIKLHKIHMLLHITTMTCISCKLTYLEKLEKQTCLT